MTDTAIAATALAALQALERAKDARSALWAALDDMQLIAEQLMRSTDGESREQAVLFSGYVNDELESLMAISLNDIHYPLHWLQAEHKSEEQTE